MIDRTRFSDNEPLRPMQELIYEPRDWEEIFQRVYQQIDLAKDAEKVEAVVATVMKDTRVQVANFIGFLAFHATQALTSAPETDEEDLAGNPDDFLERNAYHQTLKLIKICIETVTDNVAHVAPYKTFVTESRVGRINYETLCKYIPIIDKIIGETPPSSKSQQ